MIYILIYVDDIIITGSSNSATTTLTQQLNIAFSLKDIGPLNYFLSIEVIRASQGDLLLSLAKYIQDLLVKANMAYCKPLPTPMVFNLKLSASGGSPFENPSLYRSVVGSLQYVTITRPELAFPVNKGCQFMQWPMDSHWKAVKRILKYLSGTKTLSLHLPKPACL